MQLEIEALDRDGGGGGARSRLFDAHDHLGAVGEGGVGRATPGDALDKVKLARRERFGQNDADVEALDATLPALREYFHAHAAVGEQAGVTVLLNVVRHARAERHAQELDRAGGGIVPPGLERLVHEDAVSPDLGRELDAVEVGNDDGMVPV